MSIMAMTVNGPIDRWEERNVLAWLYFEEYGCNVRCYSYKQYQVLLQHYIANVSRRKREEVSD